jgi:hypothetical protein
MDIKNTFRGRSHGCQGNDGFSVFAFLAFLLALVDLYLELQVSYWLILTQEQESGFLSMFIQHKGKSK